MNKIKFTNVIQNGEILKFCKESRLIKDTRIRDGLTLRKHFIKSETKYNILKDKCEKIVLNITYEIDVNYGYSKRRGNYKYYDLTIRVNNYPVYMSLMIYTLAELTDVIRKNQRNMYALLGDCEFVKTYK